MCVYTSPRALFVFCPIAVRPTGVVIPVRPCEFPVFF